LPHLFFKTGVLFPQGSNYFVHHHLYPLAGKANTIRQFVEMARK
jgi:hypothetical protein